MVSLVGDLPLTEKGQTDGAHVKAEGTSVNDGLRPGSAVVFDS